MKLFRNDVVAAFRGVNVIQKHVLGLNFMDASLQQDSAEGSLDARLLENLDQCSQQFPTSPNRRTRATGSRPLGYHATSAQYLENRDHWRLTGRSVGQLRVGLEPEGKDAGVGSDRDQLPSGTLIGYGSRVDPTLDPVMPEELSARCIQRPKITFGTSNEQNSARRGEDTRGGP